MNRLRVLAGVTGLIALVLGVYAVTNAEAVTAITDTLLAVVGSDYVLIAILGLLAFGVVSASIAMRAVTGIQQAQPPTPETIPTAPPPGHELDHALTNGSRTGHDHVRPRLREAAIRTLMRVENCSRGVATARIDDGTWTDDPVAAAYLGGDTAPTPGLLTRLQAGVTTSARARARHAATAIVDLDHATARR